MNRGKSFLKRLARDESGLAFVEFALAAPLLLLLILGGLELANYSLAQMRVNQIAMTVADNAGRVQTSIDEANIYEVFAGAAVIGNPMDFKTNGRVILSSLEHNRHKDTNEGQMVNWQRCWGDLSVKSAYANQNDGRNDSSLVAGMGPTGKKIYSLEGSAVMFVEVIYDYEPLVDTSFMVLQKRMRHESAFNVRERTNNNINNAQGLAVNSCT